MGSFSGVDDKGSGTGRRLYDPSNNETDDGTSSMGEDEGATFSMSGASSQTASAAEALGPNCAANVLATAAINGSGATSIPEASGNARCSPQVTLQNLEATGAAGGAIRGRLSGRRDGGSAYRSFGVFIFHSGIPSYCFRMAILAGLLFGVGILGRFKFPTVVLGPVPIVPLFLSLGVTITIFVVSLTILHAFLVYCHGRRLFYEWSFIHYMSELEVHTALMLTVIAILICLCIEPLPSLAERWIFVTSDFRLAYIKTCLGVLMAAAMMAYKRHMMSGLAVSFNYSNYRERVQESLFADRILNLLQKAKHTYKFRQKWKSKDDTSLFITGHSAGRLRSLGEVDVLKTSRIGRPGGESSVKSVVDLFSSVGSPAGGSSFAPSHHQSLPQSPVGVMPPPTSSRPLMTSPLSHDTPHRASSTNASTHNPHLPPLDIPPMSPYPAPVTPSLPMRSVAIYLTESDQKRQFVEFFRLVNKMISRFSNVADYRNEIAAEASRMSSKLYKYLRQYDREYLLGEDLLPYIENEDEFRRAVTLLKRYIEGSTSNTTGPLPSLDDATSFAFSQADLQRAVDGILMELYVTAKSLQTIETALDKVDLFFTILIALIMIILVTIVVGDAVKLLLALSTMLSGAAFAFGTSARNMFESMIFLLVIHPFDVGDRVFIPLGTTMVSFATTFASMAGVDALDNLVVSEMHVLSTVFERWDGVKLYVPNYVLAAKPIFNVRRSGPLLEIQRIHVDFSTPISKIDELRNRLDEWIRRETTDYTDISRVIIDSMENCNRINLNVIFQHSTNWQDLDQQLARRSKVLAFVKETLDSLGITYLPPMQRVALVPSSAGASGDKLISGAEVEKLLQIARSNATARLPV